MKSTVFGSAVSTIGAALIVGLVGITTAVTSAEAQKSPNGRGGAAPVARSGGPGPSFRGAGPGPSFRSGAPQGNFRAAAPQFRGGPVGNRFAGAPVRQFSGAPQFNGRVNNGRVNNGRYYARRHFRGGPGIYAYGAPYYYDDGYYDAYPAYTDDDGCYETRRVLRYGTWQYVRVYVCE